MIGLSKLTPHRSTCPLQEGSFVPQKAAEVIYSHRYGYHVFWLLLGVV